MSVCRCRAAVRPPRAVLLGGLVLGVLLAGGGCRPPRGPQGQGPGHRHEIAHALAHHANERLTRQAMRQRAAEAANGALGRMDPRERRFLIGLLAGGAELNSLKYDRQQESEADHIGLFLMTFAGYDPDQALAFWQRMERVSAERGRPPAILSTHPSDAQRIAQMRKWIPEAKAAKRAYDEGRVAPEAR